MDGPADDREGPDEANEPSGSPAGPEAGGDDSELEWIVDEPEPEAQIPPDRDSEPVAQTPAVEGDGGPPAEHGVVRRRRLVAGLVVTLLLAGIGVAVWRLVDQGTSSTPKVAGTPAEVVTLVNGLQQALTGRDYQTICDSFFTSQAREAAGGDNCPSVLAQAGAKITAPILSIRSVAVAGGEATVGVIASAAGERPASDELHLLRGHGRFRIASAGIVRGKQKG